MSTHLTVAAGLSAVRDLLAHGSPRAVSAHASQLSAALADAELRVLAGSEVSALYDPALIQTAKYFGHGVALGSVTFGALWAVPRVARVTEDDAAASALKLKQNFKTSANRPLTPLSRLLESPPNIVPTTSLQPRMAVPGALKFSVPAGESLPLRFVVDKRATLFLRGALLRVVGPTDRVLAVALDLMTCATGSKQPTALALHHSFSWREGEDGEPRRLVFAAPPKGSRPGRVRAYAMLSSTQRIEVADETGLNALGYVFPVGGNYCWIMPEHRRGGGSALRVRLYSYNPLLSGAAFFRDLLGGATRVGKTFPWTRIEVDASQYTRLRA